MKESSSEEELLERSLKKTMATAAVGCETMRARKQTRSVYSLGSKKGGNRGNVTCGHGEKGVGGGKC